jgi:hypothetical protein
MARQRVEQIVARLAALLRVGGAGERDRGDAEKKRLPERHGVPR